MYHIDNTAWHIMFYTNNKILLLITSEYISQVNQANNHHDTLMILGWLQLDNLS